MAEIRAPTPIMDYDVSIKLDPISLDTSVIPYDKEDNHKEKNEQL